MEYDVIVGIDPSLSNTGVVAYDVATDKYRATWLRTGKLKCGDPGRLVWIAEQAALCIADRIPEANVLLAIEDHAGQQGHAAVNVAVQWFIRATVASFYNAETLVIAPSSGKKFGTGRGNMDEKERCAVIWAKWGHHAGAMKPNPHVADAMSLCQLARCWAGVGSGWEPWQVSSALNQNQSKGAPQRMTHNDTASLRAAREGGE